MEKEPGKIAEYLRVKEMFRPVARRLTQFIDKTLGPQGVLTALQEFLLRPDKKEWKEMREMGSFLSAHQVLLYNWIVFNLLYRPIPVDESDPGIDLPADLTLSELFLELNKETLSESEKEIIRAITRKPFTLAEVRQCITGRRLIVRDILKQQEAEILDPDLSAIARQGDIYYCRIVLINNLPILFDAYSPFAVPRLYKPRIIALRKAIVEESRRLIDDQALSQYEAVIRQAYLELSRMLFRPVLPRSLPVPRPGMNFRLETIDGRPER